MWLCCTYLFFPDNRMELWLSNNVDDDWIIRINENKTILSLLSHNSKELRVIPKISLTSPFTIIRDSSRIFQRYSTLNEMTTRFYAVIWRRQNIFFDIKKEGKKLKKVNVQNFLILRKLMCKNFLIKSCAIGHYWVDLSSDFLGNH